MKKVLKKVLEYFRKNWRLGKASTVTMVLAISMMSCGNECTECYDVTRTVYYPEFSTYSETVCYTIQCND